MKPALKKFFQVRADMKAHQQKTKERLEKEAITKNTVHHNIRRKRKDVGEP